MAITVTGKNYNQLSTCETTSSGGTWTGVDTPDSANYKEGLNSLCGTLKAAGNNDAIFAPTIAVDMTGIKHLRVWYINTSGGLINTFANGGIQLGISDGTNTGYWKIAGRDTYEGGWINLCVDVSRAVDLGIKPTNMNAITSIIVRHNQLTGKNVDNVWVDNLCLCDGLIAYGDDAGGYFDFEDIFQGDLTSLGIGILRKIGGQYFSTGSIEIGDSAGTVGCKFQAKSQVVIFEDRPVNSTLYGINVVDNGTGVTEFILGDKVGTAGIQGCTIRTASETQTPKFYVDGFTDTDVDNFKLYGSIFFDGGLITFGKAAVTTEILNCSFESCLQVDPKDANISGCFFINTSDTDSALLWNDSIDILSCSFIGNTTGAGIEHPDVNDPYDYYDLLFSGNTYDGLNTSGSDIDVNNNGTSNASTDEGANTITYLSAITLTITVTDSEGDPVENALAYIDDPLNTEPYILNTTTNGSGVASTGWGGGSVANAVWRVRLYGYKPFVLIKSIGSIDIDIPVTLVRDPQQV